MRDSHQTGLQRAGEFFLAALVLGILMLYVVARFFSVGYIGFHYSGPTGQVISLYTPENGQPPLRAGDQVLAINGQSWIDVRSLHTTHPLEAARPGDVFRLQVERTGDIHTVMWTIPGYNQPEFFSRLINTWPIAFVYWLAGTAALVLLRPQNTRWALLVAFNYITAIWLSAGGVSTYGVMESSYVLRAGIWLSIPIYLQFHWNLPQEIKKLPAWFWWSLYLAATGIALLQWLGRGSYQAYVVAFAVAVIGSVLILTYRLLLRPAERPTIRLIFLATLIILAPALVTAIGNLSETSAITQGYLISMVALPGVYFYVVVRRQLGDLEFRANRLISLYLFLVLLVTFSLLILPPLYDLFPSLSGAGGALIFTAIITSLSTVLGFDSFQRFIEQRVLGISQAPRRVLESFAGRLSTSLTLEHLAILLRDEALPNLLIRQSALVDFDLPQSQMVLYHHGVTPEQIPDLNELKRLAALGPTHWPSGAGWTRATFPIAIGKDVRGLWLLGRKDPDDYYSQEERQLLKSIADQTAIAMANISQAQSLRALHQADIERQEAERIHLARELHDDILHRIAELGNMVSDSQYADGFGAKMENLVHQVRILINGLRPPLVDQGIYFALQELASKGMANSFTKLKVSMDIPPSYARFDPMIEQHLFRIVQQACENAVQHSQANKLSIRGEVNESGVDITVEDTGSGFTLKSGDGLSEFLGQGHFGLAGMQERATMIGAKLTVETAPGKGTRVHLNWRQLEKQEVAV